METVRINLVTALVAAISATATSGPGEWAVFRGEDYVQLVWTADEAETGEMYGDEPWNEWGGNAIIEASGLHLFDDSGIDSYTDRYGDPVVSQWVQWNVE